MRWKIEYGLRAKHEIIDSLRKMIQSPYTHYEAYCSCRKECESIALTAEHIKTQKSEYKIQCKEAERDSHDIILIFEINQQDIYQLQQSRKKCRKQEYVEHIDLAVRNPRAGQEETP